MYIVIIDEDVSWVEKFCNLLADGNAKLKRWYAVGDYRFSFVGHIRY